MTNPLFESLGMRWNRKAISPIAPTINSIERATFRFHKMLPEFVWDASVLEGNPFTFQEVKTLMDGVTVGGRKLSDQDAVHHKAGGALVAIKEELLQCSKQEKGRSFLKRQ